MGDAITAGSGAGNTWRASWIWRSGDRWTVNAHILARTEFDLPGAVAAAPLRIAAYADYKLLVNGVYVGRGPVPGDPYRYQFYDTHDISALLKPGRNAFAVVCHNYGLGVHWRHKGPGGLIAQLDAATEAGPVTVCTDETWAVTRAACYGPATPRMFWASGFMETFDARQVDDRWTRAGFDDHGWERPEALDPRATRLWPRLIPREIPLLREAYARPVAMERGDFSLPPVHAVRFAGVLKPGEGGLVYAATHVYAEARRDVTLHMECDDAFKLFVDGRRVMEQNYDEAFARTRVWRGLDEYEQVHDGMGPSGFTATVTLCQGWNNVVAAVDHGSRGWGFTLAPLDPQSGTVLDLPFGADRSGDKQWTVAGPFASTGMSDSLDDVATGVEQLAQLAPPRVAACDPFDYKGVTDYATLMAYERRSKVERAAPGDEMGLRPGESCVVDLGVVTVGYPTLTLDAAGEAILDIGYSQTLPADRSIRFSNGGRMKYVDRVYARDGEQTWQPLQRRTGRYIHVSCRAGDGVALREVGVYAVGYPVEEVGSFACSDDTLNKIWETSVYTTRLLMQDGYQDCLKREEGTLNTYSFNYASRAAACLFGDYALARQGLRTAIRTRDESGWFDSHGISSPNSDEPTECLGWAVWLKDYYLYSGDRAFVGEVFAGLEDSLRYFAKAGNRHGLLDGRNWPIFRQGQNVYLDDTQIQGPYTGYFGGELLGYNILYYAALRAASFLARELGLAERAGFYNRKAERVRRSINGRFWDPGRDRYADWRKGDELAPTLHPVFAIAALYHEVPDEGQARALLRHLCDEVGLPDEDKTDYPLRTFGYYYYLEALFRHGRDDLAYTLLRRYYGRWLELGATTFGEFFFMPDFKGKATLDQEYEVHGYGTSAHLHFYANILGVRPAAPGFARVRFAPHPGDLREARGAVHTPLGLIRVAWSTRGGVFAMEIEAPPDIAYGVEPPPGFAECRVRVNGVGVPAHGAPVHEWAMPVARGVGADEG